MGTGTLPRRRFLHTGIPAVRQAFAAAGANEARRRLENGVRQILGDGCWERGHLARMRPERRRSQAHLQKIGRTPLEDRLGNGASARVMLLLMRNADVRVRSNRQ